MKNIALKIMIIFFVVLLFCIADATADYVIQEDISWFSLQPGAAPFYLSFESLYTDYFSGSFNVDIPIVLPPGTNGRQPQISLNYNSSQANGLCGVGWNFNLGSIERSTKHGIPNYNSTDTFIFSFAGSVLELVRITGQEYKPKIESSFWKFIFKDERFWEVWDKSGTKYTFGSKDNSKSNNFQWCIDEIKDTKSNYVSFTYSKEKNQIYPLQIQYAGNRNSGFYPKHTIDFQTQSRDDWVLNSRAGFQIETRNRLKEIQIKTNGQWVRRYVLDYSTSDAGLSLLNSITQYGSDNSTSLPANNFTYQGSQPTFASDEVKWLDHSDAYSRNDEERRIDALYVNNLASLVDMNGDGLPDLVYNTYGGTTGYFSSIPIYDWKVRLNTGNGFAENETLWLDHSQAYSDDGQGYHVHSLTLNNLATLSDVNGDGRPDLVYNKYADTVYYIGAACDIFDWMVRYNTGNGFSNPVKWLDHSQTYFLDETPHDSGYVAITVNQFSTLADFNGDGLADLVYNKYGDYIFEMGAGWNTIYDWYVHLSTGNSFSNTQTKILECEDAYFRQEGFVNNPYVALTTNNFATLSDLNGDGLADFVYNTYGGLWTAPNSSTKYPLYDWMVRYNEGGSLSNDPVKWLDHTLTYSLAQISGLSIWSLCRVSLNQRATLADINGDGLADLVYNTYADYRKRISGLTYYTYLFDWMARYNTGSGFSQDTIKLLDHDLAWFEDPNIVGFQTQALLVNKYATLSDINGDGLADFVFNKYADTASYYPAGLKYPIYDWMVRDNPAEISNLLQQHSSSQGSTTDIDYEPSTIYDNTGSDEKPDLPFVIQTVSSVTVNDGMDNQYTTSYNYQDGYFEGDQREFRGFGFVTETDPEGVITESEFYQDNIKKGRLKEQRIKDPQGQLFLKNYNDYGYQKLYDDVYFVYLNYTDNYTYDGDSSSKQTHTQYYYDSYGNISQTTYQGDLSADYHEYREYTYNTSKWIVNKPSHTYTKDAAYLTKKESWFSYDGDGYLIQQEDWLNTGDNPITYFAYDSCGNQTSLTNPRGYTITTVYDPDYHTFPLWITNHLGHRQQFSYDARFGKVASETDPNNRTTTYSYDVFGNLAKVVKPYDSEAQPTVSYDYDYWSMPRKKTTFQREQSSTANLLISYEFTDGLVRLLQSKSESENPSQQTIVNTFYNHRADKTQEYLPYFDSSSSSYSTPKTTKPKTTYEYDPLYRLTRITNPDSTYKLIDYNDWVISKTDENGHIRRLYQDAFGRIIELQEVNQGTIYHTYYTYDCLGNLLTIRDNQANQTTYAYDSLSRKISSDEPDKGPWSFSYDVNGNLTAQTDAKAQTINFQYDGLDRPTLKDYPNGFDLTFAYDNQDQPNRLGRLSFVNFSYNGSKEFFYDDRGRNSSIIYTIDSINYPVSQSFDTMDRLATLTYPDGEVLTYNYNSAGFVESVTNYVNNVDYNPSGQISYISFANGTYTNYQYNPNNLRLTSLITNGGSLQNFAYQYDNVGNITTINDYAHTAGQSFQYDDLNRLTSASGSYGGFSYQYDSIGNMTNKAGVGLYYGQGAAGPHAVTSTSQGLQISYDANGNMLAQGKTSYTYNYDNRLIRAEAAVEVNQMALGLVPGWNFISSPFEFSNSSIPTVLASISTDYDQLSRFDPTLDSFQHYIGDANYDQFTQFDFGQGYQVYITNPLGTNLSLSGELPPEETQVQLKAGWNLIANPNVKAKPVEEALRGLNFNLDYNQVVRYNPDTAILEYFPGSLTELIPGEAYYIYCLADTTWNITPLIELTEFAYDEQGRRIEKLTPDGPTTLYIDRYYETSLRTSEEATGGSPEQSRGTISTTKYIFLGDQRIASVSLPAGEADEAISYYHTDHLGSSNVITDSSGSQMQLLEYKPYGDLNLNSGTDITDYKFTGKELDESTELYYFNHRYYDANLARFITADPLNLLILQGSFNSQDPIAFRYTQLSALGLTEDNLYSYLYDPQNLNHYSYCNNNPINYVDPLGLEPEAMEKAEKKLKELWEQWSKEVTSEPGTFGGEFWKITYERNTPGISYTYPLISQSRKLSGEETTSGQIGSVAGFNILDIPIPIGELVPESKLTKTTEITISPFTGKHLAIGVEFSRTTSDRIKNVRIISHIGIGWGLPITISGRDY